MAKSSGLARPGTTRALRSGRKVLRSFYLASEIDEALRGLAVRTQRTPTQVLSDLIRREERASRSGGRPNVRLKRATVQSAEIASPVRIAIGEGTKIGSPDEFLESLEASFKKLALKATRAK